MNGAELVRRLSEAVGDYVLTGRTTSAGASSGRTLVDTLLVEYAEDPDWYNRTWLKMLSGTNRGEQRRVAQYLDADSTLLTARGFSNQVGANEEYEVHRYDPADKVRAINMAIDSLDKTLYVAKRDESLITDNLLVNSSFEDALIALLFDGDDDDSTVSDDSSIQNKLDNWGCIEAEFIAFSNGENDAGTLVDKGWHVRLSTENLNEFVPLAVQIPTDGTNGIWVTEGPEIRLGHRYLASVNLNATTLEMPELFITSFEGGVPRTRRVFMRVFQAPSGTRSTDAGTDLVIGNRAAADRTFDGQIRKTRLWDRRRSQREIEQTAAVDIPGDQQGLVGNWVVGVGSTLADRTSNENHATTSGATQSVMLNGWSMTNAPTVKIDPLRKMHGKHSIHVTAASGGAAQIHQTIEVNVKELIGRSYTLRSWIWGDAASEARLRVDWDGGTTFDNSEFHGGADEWELIALTDTVDSGATQVKVILEVAADGEAYFDIPHFYAGRIGQYRLPSSFTSRPSYVSIQSHLERPEGEFLPLVSGNILSGRLLRVEGKSALPRLTHDDQELDLTDAQANLVVARAAEKLWGTLKSRETGERERFAGLERDAALEAERLIGRRSGLSPRMGAEITDAWDMVQDGEDRTLVLKR